MRNFDDQVGAIERRKPEALATRPVIAASKSRTADADYRAKDNVQECNDRCDARYTTNYGHVCTCAMLLVDA